MQDKAALYADAGVPEYWVVNLAGGLLEVFRDARESSYHERFALEPSARITPTAWPDLELDVSSLFPKTGSDRSVELG
jgi:Uma2 family endonuclease